MKIVFSQELLYYTAIYLNITLGELGRDKDFPYSKPALYKFCSGEIPISEKAQEALNKYWNDLKLDEVDLDNIYKLADLIQAGKKKVKEYEIGKHRAMSNSKYY